MRYGGGSLSGGLGGRAPGGGQGVEALLKLNVILYFCMCKGSHKFAPLLIFGKVIK